jgi:hypothetical protein
MLQLHTTPQVHNELYYYNKTKNVSQAVINGDDCKVIQGNMGPHLVLPIL